MSKKSVVWVNGEHKSKHFNVLYYIMLYAVVSVFGCPWKVKTSHTHYVRLTMRTTTVHLWFRLIGEWVGVYWCLWKLRGDILCFDHCYCHVKGWYSTHYFTLGSNSCRLMHLIYRATDTAAPCNCLHVSHGLTQKLTSTLALELIWTPWKTTGSWNKFSPAQLKKLAMKSHLIW